MTIVKLMCKKTDKIDPEQQFLSTLPCFSSGNECAKKLRFVLTVFLVVVLQKPKLVQVEVDVTSSFLPREEGMSEDATWAVKSVAITVFLTRIYDNIWFNKQIMYRTV